MRVLYVAYEGFSEQLGQSQILPCLSGLVNKGHIVDCIGFEKEPHKLCYRKQIVPGIFYTSLRYHKSIYGTVFDLFVGLFYSYLNFLIYGVELIHIRSSVPGAMLLPWIIFSKIPVLFQAEGFWADEKADVGSWSREGCLYKAVKKIEKIIYKRANVITLLTKSAENYIRKECPYRDEIKAPIFVISTFTDLKRFSFSHSDLEKQNRGDLIYVGSFGGWYMTQEMIEFYSAWRRIVEKSRFIVVTKSPVDEIHNGLMSLGAEKELLHYSVDNNEVPNLIRNAGAGICFIKPYFSKRASAPAKLCEFLACGIPVVSNLIGDMGEILDGSDAGVVVSDFKQASLENAAKKLHDRANNPKIRQEARNLAEKWFDLDKCVEKYDQAYRTIKNN